MGKDIICYKDKTWCPFYATCAHPCSRSLTPEVWEKAKEFGLPVCKFTEKPPCWEPHQCHCEARCEGECGKL